PRAVRRFAVDAKSNDVPLFPFPRLHIVKQAAAFLRGGRSGSPATASDAGQPVLAIDVAKHTCREVIERHLIRDAVLGRSEEETAVAPPVRFHLHIELEVLVLLVSDQDSTAAERTLRAEKHAMHDREVRRRTVDVRATGVPPGEILPVEDWREAVRNFDGQRRQLESRKPFTAGTNFLRGGRSSDWFELIGAGRRWYRIESDWRPVGTIGRSGSLTLLVLRDKVGRAHHHERGDDHEERADTHA